MKKTLPIALSNRHCHLSEQDIVTLFGEGYELKKLKDLSQPGQYACEECIEVIGPKGSIKKIRVLGPARPESQVEILASDAYKLGVPIVIRDSGNLDGSPGAKIVGPKGEADIDKGIIVASRHIHMSDVDAKEFGLNDKDIVKIKIPGERGLVFENVLVRASDKFALEMHVDTEEGNASGCKNGQIVEIVE